MLRYPRVEIIKRTSYIPSYQVFYEVHTMRPNRPMQAKHNLDKVRATSYARRELATLQREGYEKAVFNSSMVDLRKFVL
jgi:conserved domain protein